MGKEYVMKSIKKIEKLAKDSGLDFNPVIFEYVDNNIMLEACTYGLPRRSRHWSHGRSYDHQKVYGEMGYSKVYEIVFTNNPAYAFLLNTNSDVINIMVGAHVFGHCHFFKNNVMFKDSDQKMVYRAAEAATRVDDYIEKYGLEKVEHLMDIGMALDNHIDWHTGVHRRKYPEKQTTTEVVKRGEFEDLTNFKGSKTNSVVERVTGENLPPHPEKDILWFMANYAPLEEWEKDILGVIREESYYFYPIVQCVTGNSMIYHETRGMIRIDSICPDIPSSVVKNIPMIGSNSDGASLGVFNTSHVHKFKTDKTIAIETGCGVEIEGTGDHPVEVIDVDGKIVLKKLEELSGDEWIALRIDTKIYGNIPDIANTFNTLKSEIKISYKHTIPNMTGLESGNDEAWEALARVAGHVCAEGNFSGNSFNFSNKEDVEIEDFKKSLLTSIGLKPSIRMAPSGVYSLSIYNQIACEKLSAMGFDKLGHSSTKEIPWFVFQGTQRMQQCFLSTYFEGDGCNFKGREVSALSKSKKLILQIQLMLLNSGIYSNILTETVDVYGKFYKIAMNGKHARRFIQDIGFLSKRKNRAIATKDIVSKCDYIPFVLDEIKEFRAQRKVGTYYKCTDGKLRHIKFGRPSLKGHISREKYLCRQTFIELPDYVESCRYLDEDLYRKVKAIYDAKDIIFTPIKNITRNNSEKYVYDVTIPGSHRFLCNGMVNHNTKVLNEGYASFFHAELMHEYDGITAEEHLEFCKCHAGVVSPGSPMKINPYYLGFKILTDIRERWDEKHKNGESEITGIQKVIEVANEEDDASFLRNYLTKELAEEFGLFNFGYKKNRAPGIDESKLTEEYGEIELRDRELNKIIENIIRPTINYGAPMITINKVDGDSLILQHKDDFGPLDEKYTEKTMSYLYELWGGPIELRTYGDDKDPVAFIYDEAGFDIL